MRGKLKRKAQGPVATALIVSGVTVVYIRVAKLLVLL